MILISAMRATASPAPTCHAIDRRNDGLVQISDVIHDVRGFFHGPSNALDVALERLDHIQIAPGRKRRPGASHDDHAGSRIVSDIEPYVRQLPVQPRVRGIVDLWTIDSDE
jgi:hypothetical protein